MKLECLSELSIYNCMTVTNASVGVSSSSSNCVNSLNCQDGVCADFLIKRHDTRPEFKVKVEDCDGPLDLTDENLVLEASMWATARFKSAVAADDTYFRLADDIGFEQIMVNDIIVVDQVRLPEQMLVIGFDETNKLVRVQRAYHGTTASAYKKGTYIRIFRVLNAAAEIESVYEDILNVDGTTSENQLTETYLVYNWEANDTCLPGCYNFEFKLLQMGLLTTSSLATATITPSWTPSNLTPEDFGCLLGSGVECVRRFPPDKAAFLIQIVDSPTDELLI